MRVGGLWCRMVKAGYTRSAGCGGLARWGLRDCNKRMSEKKALNERITKREQKDSEQETATSANG